MIRLTGVTVNYESEVDHVVALSNIQLTVGPGEFVVLSGVSGSGKSTLLNVTAGLERVTRGSIEVDDVSVESATETDLAAMRLSNVGVVFQENNLIAELSAQENVEFPLRARGLKRRESQSEARRALGLVGLGELGRRYPSQLSGGQRQRVGIARAIAGGKRYLLADEPTGALDSTTSAIIYDVMRALVDEGYGVIVASHDPKVTQWSTRIVELLDGCIIVDRSSEQPVVPVND